MRVCCVDVQGPPRVNAPGEFMQQRRVRLGDILDDYCPRERRITNHAVVAMIENEVKQTRCTTCDAEHEYKQAKVPAPRKKKPAATLVATAPDAASPTSASVETPEPVAVDDVFDAPADAFPAAPEPVTATANEDAPAAESESEPESEPNAPEDEWPVHRPLIRATLPRPEGQAPERKEPDFTIRQNGRFDRNGNRHRGKGHGRGPAGSGPARFNQHSGSGPSHRSGSGSGHGHGAGPHSGQGSRQGNRPHSGQRGRQGGQGRGPNSGHGRGRRGR